MKHAVLGDGKGNLFVTDEAALSRIHASAQLVYARLDGDPNQVIQIVAMGGLLLVEGQVVTVVKTGDTYAILVSKL